MADLIATGSDELRTWIDTDRYDVRLVETEVTAVCFGVLDRESCRIETICTSPDHQREGFGQLLLEEFATDSGCERLRVVAPEGVIPFFEAAGFERRAETTWHGRAAVSLQKESASV